MLVPLGYLVNSIHGDNEALTVDEDGHIVTMKEKKADQFPRITEVAEKFNIVLYSQTISVGLDVPSDLFHYGVHYFKNKTGS